MIQEVESDSTNRSGTIARGGHDKVEQLRLQQAESTRSRVNQNNLESHDSSDLY
jgi:hypothetical protein